MFKIKLNETGRSMVEILGVLAIIGVLSIAGIMGYKYGMDKYQANKIINDINLRSVDIIHQLSNGKTPDISSWQNEDEFYPMKIERNNASGKYAIIVSEIPQQICKMVGNHLNGKFSIYINYKDFNENLCVKNDNNIMYFYLSPLQCEPECAQNEYCENGWCFKNGKPNTSNADCGRIGATCTTEDDQSGFCTYDGCIPLSGCTSNDECKNKQYCGVVNYTSNTERFPSNVRGTCIQTDFMRYEIDNKIYYVSATTLNWWNAEWACETINKKHLDISAFLSNNEPTDLSVKLSQLIGKQFIWTSTPRDKNHMLTPQLGTNYLTYDMKRNNHTRLAVCQ